MNLIETSIIKAELKKNPGVLVIVPSPAAAKVLETAGIDPDRIGTLISVWAAQGYRDDDKGWYTLMSRRQYGIWKSKEEKLINDAERKKSTH